MIINTFTAASHSTAGGMHQHAFENIGELSNSGGIVKHIVWLVIVKETFNISTEQSYSSGQIPSQEYEHIGGTTNHGGSLIIYYIKLFVTFNIFAGPLFSTGEALSQAQEHSTEPISLEGNLAHCETPIGSHSSRLQKQLVLYNHKQINITINQIAKPVCT